MSTNVRVPKPKRKCKVRSPRSYSRSEDGLCTGEYSRGFETAEIVPAVPGRPSRPSINKAIKPGKATPSGTSNELLFHVKQRKFMKLMNITYTGQTTPCQFVQKWRAVLHKYLGPWPHSEGLMLGPIFYFIQTVQANRETEAWANDIKVDRSMPLGAILARIINDFLAVQTARL
ncbi:hypothetical protein N7478_001792 [Penicillium angulare]|uniref:uncharacterized protein n=1 Tax=Penicillium angulare TaxID=116970 RepID=UPI002540F408|nr:uncharacterized protein N7478_001792 [Penicillium angulare]KAJ5288762.1 hypothetical protein N7478_001792 [Penicillium angulare]